MMKYAFTCEFKKSDLPSEVSDNFNSYANIITSTYNILHHFYNTLEIIIFNIIMIDVYNNTKQ